MIKLFIVGVEKAGTTALFRHIANSPKIYAHKQREMFYFLSDEEFVKGWEFAQEKYFNESDNKIIIAKNVMQINSRNAMLRLKNQCPDVKCILMLREPVSRAYSAYNYARSRGIENCKTFLEALKNEEKRYKEDPSANNPLLYTRNSTYADKVIDLIDIFGRDNILILFNEEYKNKPFSHLVRIEKLIQEKLFDQVTINFVEHNKSAKARYVWLAKLTYKLLKSNSQFKKIIRSVISHESAVELRHKILNFNRIETQYKAVDDEAKKYINKKLSLDKKKLDEYIDNIPW